MEQPNDWQDYFVFFPDFVLLLSAKVSQAFCPSGLPAGSDSVQSCCQYLREKTPVLTREYWSFLWRVLEERLEFCVNKKGMSFHSDIPFLRLLSCLISLLSVVDVVALSFL